MLAAAPERLRAVFPGARDPLGGMTTLEVALGRRPSFDETAGRLAGGFREVHGLELRAAGLSPEETALAESLARDKYATAAWTRDGRAPGLAWSTVGETPHRA
jgi:lipoate-protein ligase A